MKAWFSKLKIKYKIVIAIYLVSIPIIFIVSVFLYIRSSQEVESRMSDVYHNVVTTLDRNINYLQAGVVDLATYVCVNDDILSVLYAAPESPLAKYPLVWEKHTPVNFVGDMVSAKGFIKTLILYTENTIRPFYLSRDRSVHDLDIKHVHNSEVYKRSYSAKGDYVWTPISKQQTELFIKNTSDKIVVSRVIFNRSKDKQIGFLAIGIDSNRYIQLCEDSLQHKNEGIVIYNNGEELTRVGAMPNKVIEYIQSMNLKDKNQRYFRYEDYYIFQSQTSDTGNQIFYTVPKENWSEQIRNTLLLPYVFVGVMFIGLFPLSILASTVITKPLQRLYHAMMIFKKGDFEQHVAVSAYDEIGEVTDCFNRMVKDIKELVDTNYVMVLKEKESELNALQAQINPHFLYNTLDSLYWQAFSTGNDKLAEDIFSLSKLFRLVLSQGNAVVPIEQEKELIFYYLQIQKMRFNKKLNYNIDIEEGILQYKIPKLILQPFVENAIVHGLECTEKTGMIEVTGRQKKDTIEFEIKDNGVGMTDQQLKAILVHEDAKEYSCQRIGRFAIRNVKERLDLKYRDRYKLEIQSRLGHGTKIKITIPLNMDEV